MDDIDNIQSVYYTRPRGRKFIKKSIKKNLWKFLKNYLTSDGSCDILISERARTQQHKQTTTWRKKL
jgi:intein/homing endonuclease